MFQFFSILIPTQDQNQPSAGFGPSGFIIFCPFKNLGTYQDIFLLNITYGVVNSTKIWAKSSSP